MIRIDNISVLNFENAVRGMRNPMNSWDKSDSAVINGKFTFGEADLSLAKKLVKAGTDHRKFMRQIIVSMDITAPMYWWKEFDTYKVGTVANSTSTMHRIHSKAFTLDDFSHDHMDDDAKKDLENVIKRLEHYRQLFTETRDKQYWYDMIQLLPSSYNQMRTVTMNYENLTSIYYARKDHKLAEWRTFTNECRLLPYFGALAGIYDER